MLHFSKRLYSFCCLMVFLCAANAQMSVLVVDDSEDTFDNTKYLASSLDSLGIDYFYFDAVNSGLPDITVLNAYDLVLWHTSTWGQNLQFWNAKDEDNSLLIQYLAQPTANLWLIGNDFMFDRYGIAPDAFASGSFVYDYLGIKNYAAQAYGDDGSKGVPYVKPATNNPINGLKDISWTFSTLWWADKYEIRDEASPIYLFGGDTYVLNNSISGLFYPRPNGSKVMTFGFDLSLAADFSSMKNTVKNVLEWWNTKITKTDDSESVFSDWNVYPTVILDDITIHTTNQIQQPIKIDIYGVDGKLVHTEAHSSAEVGNIWNVPLSNVKVGTYYCKISSSSFSVVKKIVKI